MRNCSVEEYLGAMRLLMHCYLEAEEDYVPRTPAELRGPNGLAEYLREIPLSESKISAILQMLEALEEQIGSVSKIDAFTLYYPARPSFFEIRFIICLSLGGRAKMVYAHDEEYNLWLVSTEYIPRDKRDMEGLVNSIGYKPGFMWHVEAEDMGLVCDMACLLDM